MEENITTPKPLILVAEDDESNFNLIKAIIGRRCDLAWARNGEEAVRLYQSGSPAPAAILMDIKMPVMNGLEAMRAIRATNRDIPIIVQTAYAFSSDKENALSAGANEVLVKPITSAVLRGALIRFLPELSFGN
ncbi:MAG: response regulator [Mediterranea sp.]|jgi:CheY-like chemotaxis protein|nr:response regulator [Mediterranea sp.]